MKSQKSRKSATIRGDVFFLRTNKHMLQKTHGRCPNLDCVPDLKTMSKSDKIIHSKIAYEYVRPVLDVLRCFVKTVKIKDAIKWNSSIARLYIDCIILSKADTLMSVLKHDLRLISCRAYGNDLDKKFLLMKGRIQKFIRSKCAKAFALSPKWISFCTSMYESKRDWPEQSEKVEFNALKTHKHCLSSTQDPSKEIMRRMHLFFKSSFDYLGPKAADNQGTYVATYGACYQNNRKKGGNKNYVSIDHPITLLNRCSITTVDKMQRTKILGICQGEKSVVKVVTIPEPGKVRTITVGPAGRSTLCRRLQQDLLALWKACPYGTMQPDMEKELIARFTPEIRDDENYLSVDYSNATDFLSPEVTFLFLETVFDYYNSDGRRHKGYTNEEMFYIYDSILNRIEHPHGDFQQTNGQLMGHPLSFPILCFANLFTFFESYKISGRIRSVRNFYHHPLVLALNGDDGCGVVTLLEKTFQESISSDIGLVINSTKTRLAKRLATINSRTILLLPGRVPRIIPYLRLALAKGTNIKKGSDSYLDLHTAKAIWETVSSCSYGLNIQLGILVKRISQLFQPKDFHMNFFIHEDLGGLGLSSRFGARNKYHITSEQIATAHAIMCCGDSDNVVGGPSGLNNIDQDNMDLLKKLSCRRLPFVDGHGRRLFGPLNEQEDATLVNKSALNLVSSLSGYRKVDTSTLGQLPKIRSSLTKIGKKTMIDLKNNKIRGGILSQRRIKRYLRPLYHN